MSCLERTASQEGLERTAAPAQVYDNPVLGMWAWKVRRDYRNNKLAQWKIDRLNEVEFLWKPDAQSTKWHHNLHEARRYKVLPLFQAPHLLVPGLCLDTKQVGWCRRCMARATSPRTTGILRSPAGWRRRAGCSARPSCSASRS